MARKGQTAKNVYDTPELGKSLLHGSTKSSGALAQITIMFTSFRVEGEEPSPPIYVAD
jgi:hypothetical protein